MNKDRLMYEFAREGYKEALDRKNEIRNRSSIFYGLGVPIIAALVISCITLEGQISCTKAILLILSGLFSIASTIFFLLIIIPSSQVTYFPKQLMKDIIYLEDSKENATFLKNKPDSNLQEKLDYLAYTYFSSTYSQMFDFYEEKNKKFTIYFALFSSLIFLTITLLIIAHIV